MEYSNERSAAELISCVVDAVVAGDNSGVTGIVRAWSDVVGARLAAHSDIVDIRNGVLYITVDHPAWLQLIQLRSEAIRRQIAKRFPEIAIRELCLLAGQPKRAPTFRYRETCKVVDEAQHAGDTTLVADPELAATLGRIVNLAQRRR